LYDTLDNVGKKELSQRLVDQVRARGGRFLILEPSTRGWYEVPNSRAVHKAAQALREATTPEIRAARRARYGK